MSDAITENEEFDFEMSVMIEPASPPPPLDIIDLTQDSPQVPVHRRNLRIRIPSRRGIRRSRQTQNVQNDHHQNRILEVTVDEINSESEEESLDLDASQTSETFNVESPESTHVEEEDSEYKVNKIPYLDNTIDGNPVPLTCPICFESLSSRQKPMTTRCGHIFCSQCLNFWLQEKFKRCPKCQKSITKESCIRLYF